ncbi:MAG: WhiB family transcriptional regulator [Actinomycetota bacterium]|nr:WhiB family transcriptional regulator [Actinomycetota bacterium]
MADGLCREYPEVEFFPEQGGDARPAKTVCGRCVVRDECLAWAVEHDERGVWGGTTRLERARMAKAA